ncbi:hypothetical protein [Flavilitoribacter nigricans]|uniref:Uncharacterized protein n=1 Tax=Flavilitoribacter nigricans (strain ATCC 23147 / DSM 23189 / NBRC 102662 / NCIMB 1420 / SS-2) TaxID=1122177 RepID=A0A2D0N4I7_FLAN2|nr:hypothetical protein [Flavilitoribacter nigricans]PHN03414.1 hypothetical protein CRP01_27410 [Flavilitoribacter nigricans DSM 23189 = NBRC 102662]
MSIDPNFKFRQARYLFEDFQESIAKLSVIGYCCIMLAVLLVVSGVLFGADSNLHALFSAASGLALILAPRLLELEERSMIYFLLAAYLLVVAVEYLTLGLPDRFIPGLGEYGRTKVIGLVTILNDLTPLLYFGIRLGVSYLFFRVLFFWQKVDQLPGELKMRLGLKK